MSREMMAGTEDLESLTANWPYQAVGDARVGARRPSLVNGFTAEMLGAQIWRV
jgi:hypothetical protein